MNKQLIAALIVTFCMFSCSKEELVVNTTTDAVKPSGVGNETTGRMNCEPFPFAVLALNQGKLSSNNMNINGCIGYSRQVSSSNNALLNISGDCFVHSNVTTFTYTLGTLLPVLGLQTGEMVDWKLDESNDFATSLTSTYSTLEADYTFNSVVGNKTINSTCVETGNPNTIVYMDKLELTNGKKLTLVGDPSSDDGFIINILGSMTLSEAEIILTNIRPERVLFNFPNPSTVQVKNNTKFRGTILSPTGTVMYLNPYSFEGSIVAKYIYAANTAASTCGTGTTSTFTQKTYCNGYQW